MLQKTSLTTPSTLPEKAVQDISGALLVLVSDVFALYLKTKNFHWHMSGPHFRDYHLLLDEQADQIFAMTDPIAERDRHRPPDQRHVRPPAGAPGQRRRRLRGPRRLVGADQPEDLVRSHRQPGHLDRLQAVDRRERRAAHRHLQQ